MWVGEVFGAVFDGDDLREITANRVGVVKDIAVAGGSFIEGGTVLAETKARGSAVFSSMLSAVLGTMAFAALTMGFLLRRTTLAEWLILAAATLLLYWPGYLTDGAGLMLVSAVIFMQRIGREST